MAGREGMGEEVFKNERQRTVVPVEAVAIPSGDCTSPRSSSASVLSLTLIKELPGLPIRTPPYV